MKRTLVLVVLVVLTEGCKSSTSAPPAEDTIRVTVSEAVAESGLQSGAIRIRAVFTVENRGDEDVRYMPCRAVIERLIQEEWIGVWGRSCVGPSEPQLVLSRGASLVDSSIVEFVRQAGGQPEWYYGPVAGTYRLRTGITGLNSNEVSPLAISSNTFTLAEPIAEAENIANRR